MILALILTLLFGGCNRDANSYLIEGTTAKQSGYYYLLEGYNIVDSAEVVNGHYRFEGQIDTRVPVRNIASASSAIEVVGNTRFAQVILEGGTIGVSEDDYSPTGGLKVVGTKGNEAMYNFAVEAMALQEQIRDCFDNTTRKRLMTRYEKLVDRTIRRNLDNYAGVNLLMASGGRYSTEQRREFIERMSSSMRQTEAVENMIENLNTNNN